MNQEITKDNFQNLLLLTGWLAHWTLNNPMLKISIDGNITDCHGADDEEEHNPNPFKNQLYLNFHKIYVYDGKLALIEGWKITEPEQDEKKLISIPFDYGCNVIVRPREYGYFFNFRISSIQISEKNSIDFNFGKFPIISTGKENFTIEKSQEINYIETPSATKTISNLKCLVHRHYSNVDIDLNSLIQLI